MVDSEYAWHAPILDPDPGLLGIMGTAQTSHNPAAHVSNKAHRDDRHVSSGPQTHSLQNEETPDWQMHAQTYKYAHMHR